MTSIYNAKPTVIEVIGMGSKKYGGFEKYIVEENRQLKAIGYHLVVCFSLDPIAKEYLSDLENAGADWYVVPFKGHIQHYKAIKSLIKKYNTVAIHTNFSSCGLSALLAAKQCNVKHRISTQHCLPTFDSLKLKLIYNSELLLCTKYLCVSKTSENAMLDGLWWNKNKVKTEYLGVEDFNFDKPQICQKYNIPCNKVIITNIAYHNSIKGVDVLLEAVDLLVNKNRLKNFLVLQIGGGQNPEQTAFLHELEAKYGISDYIRWVGLTNMVPEYLFASDIYCQPSRSEGIPLSIMEASLANIPTVATKVGGIVESVIDGKTGILVDPEKPQQIADALSCLINDSEKRLRMGSNARQHALEYFKLSTNVTNLLCHYGINTK
ncbi:glycosyltransferase family 4 protein [Macellibacteroides fermentans]|uniref:glycosyltransferase family 4 protein n=1 Tax=Macellibacteroides fermentans TaxID=879969 RepID=UPI003B9246BC